MNEQISIHPNLLSRTYLVGGAVRDQKMGGVVEDHDFVVEATKEEFEKYHPQAPLVGKDFPVYLIDGCEVALTRTERSTGNGYGDFELDAVGVPIEADLGRRDITINAMAIRLSDWEFIDPFNGATDLERGNIRTMNVEAFREDPVRILRAARFAARFGFKLDSITAELMHESAAQLQFVTKERIVLELEKMWKQAAVPRVFFEVLADADALKFVFPEVDALRFVTAGPVEHHHGKTAFQHTMDTVTRAKGWNAKFHVFMAMVFHDTGKGQTDPELLPKHAGHEERSTDIAKEFFADHRFSKRVNEFVPKAAELHMKAHRVEEMSPRKMVRLAKKMGRRDFFDLFVVFDCDHPLNPKQVEILEKMRKVLFETDMSEISSFPPAQRAQRAHQAMVTHMKRSLKNGPLS